MSEETAPKPPKNPKRIPPFHKMAKHEGPFIWNGKEYPTWQAMISAKGGTAAAPIVGNRKGQPLNENEKAAIIMMRAKYMPATMIAKRIRRTVKLVQGFILQTEKDASFNDVPDYKNELKMKSIDAIHKGLEHKRDPYKRASLGVNVMKGIGEFQNDGANVNIQNVMASVPPEWRDRYIRLDGDGEQPA
jgi:hypothetical protein